jgi:hypothetical protein
MGGGGGTTLIGSRETCFSAAASRNSCKCEERANFNDLLQVRSRAAAAAAAKQYVDEFNTSRRLASREKDGDF